MSSNNVVGERPSDGAASQQAQPPQGQGQGQAQGSEQSQPNDEPSLSLPKAGGAVRGMGEKFSANPVTGTASVSVPVAMTDGRGGFGPKLALSYDSGAGNGPFGLGWAADVPSISRRTDKGVPRYLDDAYGAYGPVGADGPGGPYESEGADVFQLSGAEDLVPAVFPAPRTEGTYDITAYRPRTEGLWSRIERWRDRTSGDTHWRVISKDNVTSVFGRTPAARVTDPADTTGTGTGAPTGTPRVFRWLLEEVSDDLGNIAAYTYKQEDRAGVDDTSPQERNRAGTGSANRYLKRVRYGNAQPGVADDFAFEAVLDYGEHDPDSPTPDEIRPWTVRPDAFSNRRAGFEVRTYRLCARILMFHRFPELGPDPVLVRSTDLTHQLDPVATKLVAVTDRGYIRTGGTGTGTDTGTDTGTGTAYEQQAAPALTFSYTERVVSTTPGVLTAEHGDSVPQLASGFRWTDLDGEGIPGLLAEQDGAWYYRPNRGGGVLGAPRPVDPLPPGASLNAGWQLMDLAGEGRPALTALATTTPGFHRRDEALGWGDFTPFATLPNLPWNDRGLRFVDLTGDGLSDVLLTGSEGFCWHPSRGPDGFGDSEYVAAARTEERGPLLVFADAAQSVYLADMTGDGLTDLVRVGNGEIAYWPNLGHGAFGPKVPMAGSPLFDHPDRFDQRRVHLSDIDGTGPTDLLYAGPDGFRVWFNECGNAWSAPERIDTFLPPDPASGTGPGAVSVADVLGKGTACLVVGEARPDGEPQLRYLDLMAAGKPHLMTVVDNGMGLRTTTRYETSTAYYLADKAAGQPWFTTLPFPVMVVAESEVRDTVADTTLVSVYRYRHGHYDGVEREFRGFGYVEERDDLSAAGPADPLRQPTAVARRWQHTGWYAGRDRISQQFAAEYWHPGATGGTGGTTAGPLLPDTVLPDGLTTREEREAARALRGHTLREEIHNEPAADGTWGAPYSVIEHSYRLRLLQPRGSAPYSVVFATSAETLTLHTEGDPADPRIEHELHLDWDDWGNVLRSADIAYPRRAATDPEQLVPHVTTVEQDVVNDIAGTDRWHIGVPVEQRGYEIGGTPPAAGTGYADARYGVYTEAEIRTALTNSATATIPYQDALTGTQPQRRQISRSRQTYYADDLSAELPLGSVGSRALPYRGLKQAFAPGHAAAVFGDKVTDAALTEAGYVQQDGGWWVPSTRHGLDPAHFYLPVRSIDAFGSTWTTDYDAHWLRPVRAEDPKGNTTQGELNYRLLTTWLLTDANGNRSGVRCDALGRVTATAVIGKNGDGDVLDLATVETSASDDPTSRLEYHFDQLPLAYHTSSREQHGAANPRWQETWTYADGTGRTLLTKVQAEPVGTPAVPRWAGTGRTVFNNKGNPVKQYEPYFAVDGGFDTEADLVLRGVTSVLYYDPLNRLIRTEYPDGTLAEVTFDAWDQRDADRNDTVLESSWYQRRINLPPDSPGYAAATATEPHAGTATEVRFDTLGRPHVTVQDNGGGVLLATTVERDVQGHELSVTDPRGVLVQEQRYDMLGRVAYSRSADAGERRQLMDVTSKPVLGWDSRGTATRWRYDALRRPTHAYATEAGSAERLRVLRFYGEAQDDGQAHNLRTRPCAVFDGAGLLRTMDVDLQGNTLAEERWLAADPETEPDWSPLAETAGLAEALAAAASLLESAPYTTAAVYDALSRPNQVTSPDGSVTRSTYNEANLLESVDVTEPGATGWTPVVTNLDYNARGQRTLIELGNGARTAYTYEADTFRLSTVDSRSAGGEQVQLLEYAYDPMGNVVVANDAAQDTLFFANTVVPAARSYTYEPVYRLSTASGREHIGQTSPGQPGPDGPTLYEVPHVNDATAMRRYTESYAYDAAGNIERVVHSAGSAGSWTRRHSTAADSNRLVASSVPGDVDGVYSADYTYDANGNMMSMPQLARLDWDVDNRLAGAQLGGGGAAFYQYDAEGARVRATVRSGGTVETRVYVGHGERYRKVVAGVAGVQRDTLHVLDGAQRVALLETTTLDGGTTVSHPVPVARYQLSDHLGTATVELDDTSAVLSYEEYHPFGTTSFRSAKGAARVSLKRYRFTGKENDAETGLYYHGARYYAPWLGRWTAPDPAGLVDGPNRYAYARSNPVTLHDPDGRASAEPGAKPVLMGLWKYGLKVTEKHLLGKNVQVDHPIQMAIRAAQKNISIPAMRSLSKASGEVGILVETGKGLFHTELGKLQKNIRGRVLSGALGSESNLLRSTRAAYLLTARKLGIKVNRLALDTAMLSDQATMHQSLEDTVKELSAMGEGGAGAVAKKSATSSKAVEKVLAPVKKATTDAVHAVGAATHGLAPAFKAGAKEAEAALPAVKAAAPELKALGKMAGVVGNGVAALSVVSDVAQGEYLQGAINAFESVAGIGNALSAFEYGLNSVTKEYVLPYVLDHPALRDAVAKSYNAIWGK